MFLHLNDGNRDYLLFGIGEFNLEGNNPETGLYDKVEVLFIDGSKETFRDGIDVVEEIYTVDQQCKKLVGDVKEWNSETEKTTK